MREKRYNEKKGRKSGEANEMKTATKRLVRPEFMNHHQTLFAGDIIKWMTEAGFIGVAETLGRTDHVGLTAATDIVSRKPFHGVTII